MKAIKMSMFIFCFSTVLVACKSSSSEPTNNERGQKEEVESQKKDSKKSNLGGGVLPISIYPFSDNKDSSL